MKTKAMITIIFFLMFLLLSKVQAVMQDIVWTEGYHQLNTTEFVEHVQIFNDVSLDIFNCNMGYLVGYNNTSINLYAGVIWNVGTLDNCIVNIYGHAGQVALSASGNSKINLYDATLVTRIYTFGNAIVNLYAYNVKYTPYPGDCSDGTLRGINILNNKSFTIVTRQEDLNRINIIPEPPTVLLLGLGCLFLKRKKIMNTKAILGILMKSGFEVLILVCCVTSAFGTVYTVDDDGPANFNKIQDAINTSVNGDTVLVKPGIYYENINFNGKNIFLISTDPNDPKIVQSTIIDGRNYTTCAVQFSGSETEACRLNGFKITNGKALAQIFYGGGIYGNSSKPTISNCIIVNNAAYVGGGGISSCNGLIINCTISNNTVPYYYCYGGGGLYSCNGQICL